MTLRQSLTRVGRRRAGSEVREGQALGAIGVVAATVIGGAGGRHAPNRIIQFLGGGRDLKQSRPDVSQAKRPWSPGCLRYDLVGHHPRKHATGPPAKEGRIASLV